MFWRLPQHQEEATVWQHGEAQVTAAQLAAALAPLEAKLNALPHKSLGIIFCRNHPAPLQTYLATLRAGHAAMLLPADMPEALRDTLLATYQPDWIFQPQGKDWHWQSVKMPEAGGIHPELALLLPTSGSTGSPQMVRLSYANLTDNAAAIAESLALAGDDCAITSLPFYYSYGLSVVNSLLHVGGSLVLTDSSVMQPEFWQGMQRGVTHLAGVPAQYQMLKRLGLEKRAPASLRIVTQAGGRLPAEDALHFARLAEEKGWRFYTMYGQTEATARMACSSANAALNAPESIGQPLRGGTLAVDGETGELIYTGKNVMLGYAETRADLALGDTTHGVLHTGDIGTQGADGLWRIAGRIKRFLKLSGLRINLQTVEDALREHGFANASGGDDGKLRIWVEGEETADSTRSITEHLFARFGIHPTLVEVRYLPALPLNANGKVDYALLQGGAV